MSRSQRHPPTSDAFALLRVRRYTPKRSRLHHGRLVVERLYLKLCARAGSESPKRGSFSVIPIVKGEGGLPTVVPPDRVRAWEELAAWVLYYVHFRDPVIRQRQYENRLLWESWDSTHGARPGKEALYDWRDDPATLNRLRPRYAPLSERLASLIGKPTHRDVAARHPNEFEDDGLSDRARRAIRDLKLLFGDEIFGACGCQLGVS